MNALARLPIRYAESIAADLDANRPVVALESTIITHGMPWPRNLETARSVEQMVREHGASPATIAVIDGVLTIGIDDLQLEQLAQAEQVAKLSTADLPASLVKGNQGSTTVAATMVAAAHAGIRVFATGGIGGVHQGASESFDISADLNELSRTPVIVVSAGAKAILDIPKTLEVLESLAVPVIGWQCDQLPAFWSRTSPHASPIRLDRLDQIAQFAAFRTQLALPGGILVCNPVQKDHEIGFEVMQGFIEEAIGLARDAGITGKGVTPFLLNEIYRLTAGDSLETNIQLIKNNARLAAEIATALPAPE